VGDAHPTRLNQILTTNNQQLITNNQQPTTNMYLTQPEDILAIIAQYREKKTLWLDTEVADYQTTKPRLSLIQILADSTDLKGDKVIVIDVLDNPELINCFIKDIMVNPEIEKVLHNAKYDLAFLGKSKAKNVTCTLKVAGELPYYVIPLANRQLKTLAQQLCHFSPINKEEQGGDWSLRPLTPQQLEYAKMDPVYVAQVHHRLLQLTQLISPNPETENIQKLTTRYRQIEHRWKQLDSEIEHLKKRIKAAMASQNLEHVQGFQLSSQERTTKKASFSQLAKLSQEEALDLDFPLTLTKAMQKEIGETISRLSVEEEKTTVLQLKVKEIDEEDVPF